MPNYVITVVSFSETRCFWCNIWWKKFQMRKSFKCFAFSLFTVENGSLYHIIWHRLAGFSFCSRKKEIQLSEIWDVWSVYWYSLLSCSRIGHVSRSFTSRCLDNVIEFVSTVFWSLWNGGNASQVLNNWFAADVRGSIMYLFREAY